VKKKAEQMQPFPKENIFEKKIYLQKVKREFHISQKIMCSVKLLHSERKEKK
jgi:hypothetical protein